MKENYIKEREKVAAVCARIGELGYTTSQGGNISMRTWDGCIAISPTKWNKRLVMAGDVCVVDKNETVVYNENGTSPTSELPMHKHLYDIREEVAAVIHAHPPIATGFAIAHSNLLEFAVLPESCMELGPVLSVPYIDPGSEELAMRCGEAMLKTNAVLLQNHGVIIASEESIERALEMLELLEASAKSLLTAKLLGNIEPIAKNDIMRIASLYRRRGVSVAGKKGYVRDASEVFINEKPQRTL